MSAFVRVLCLDNIVSLFNQILYLRVRQTFVKIHVNPTFQRRIYRLVDGDVFCYKSLYFFIVGFQFNECKIVDVDQSEHMAMNIEHQHRVISLRKFCKGYVLSHFSE